jgi:hypothetical protein
MNPHEVHYWKWIEAGKGEGPEVPRGAIPFPKCGLRAWEKKDK